MTPIRITPQVREWFAEHNAGIRIARAEYYGPARKPPRRLPPHPYRARAIEAVRAGESQTSVAARFGLARSTVSEWMKAAREDGVA